MELNFETVTTPVRQAASVVMLRDGTEGLEVFLLRRHGLSDSFGGAHVFPGGKVDAGDSASALLGQLDRDPLVLHAELGEDALDHTSAASLYVAAIREAFEESGVLFAANANPKMLAQASQLQRDGVAFDEVLRRLSLRLDTASVVPWSRWITPLVPTVSNKRFDTRFFVSAVPQHQVAWHDNHEATESVWVRPRPALAQYWSGAITLAPPQIMSLAHLSHYSSVLEVLSAARRSRPPVIAPEPFLFDGQRVVCYPGDEHHSLRERALPGPTRLTYRNNRFEPFGGFEALFERSADFFSTD